VTAGLPFARSAVAVRREWRIKNAPEAQEKNHVRHFLTSLDPVESQRIPAAVRGHWSVENLNHYKRDTCLWREDDHRHRRVNIAQNLALTRNALLAIIPFDADKTLSSWFEVYQRHPATAIQLILHAAPVQ
jgi:predicted transposase YbfD/YdcC